MACGNCSRECRGFFLPGLRLLASSGWMGLFKRTIRQVGRNHRSQSEGGSRSNGSNTAKDLRAPLYGRANIRLTYAQPPPGLRLRDRPGKRRGLDSYRCNPPSAPPVGVIDSAIFIFRQALARLSLFTSRLEYLNSVEARAFLIRVAGAAHLADLAVNPWAFIP